ncbi:MAG: Tex-like N-terminal domain-containing protein, partial [Thiohalomonadaceae bacterium]
MSIFQRIAQELAVHVAQVEAAVRLLDEGATVPFIARYRKEVTGGLDDTQLRNLEERLTYLRELDERRATVLKSIEEQGKLTPELKAAILAADTKVRLEDLYRPYMQKRRTKAQIAKEAGLEPLADALLADPTLTPEAVAAAYVDADKGVADVAAALDGARQILMERFAEDAELVGLLRTYLWENAHLKSTVVAGKQEEGAKFSDYFEHSEPLKGVPSHRALALFRGRKEGVLNLELVIPADDVQGRTNAAEGRAPGSGQVEGRKPTDPSVCEGMIAKHVGIRAEGRPADKWLLETVRWAWRVKVLSHLDTELKAQLREGSEEEAIKVFARNLHDLLLAAPAGARATMGLDPGLRTGVKVAVVDATGKLLGTGTIYPHAPQNRWDESIATLAALCQKFNVEL